MLARQMEVYAGYLENTDHHVGLLIDTLEDLGILDETLIYVIIGDNGASAEGSLQGTFNEMITLGGFGALETAEFMSSKHRPVRWPRGVQPLRRRLGARHGHAVPVDQAGRVALGRHPQRHDRALAGPASRPRARSARSSTTSSTSRRPCWRRRTCPHRVMVNGVQQKPIEGVSMLYSFDDADAAGAPRDPVLRDVRQPRHLPQGLDGGHQAPHAVGDGYRRGRPGVRRRRLGAVRHQRRLDAGPRPRQGAPGEARRAAAALVDRGGQVPGRPARRPLRRARPARDGRTADADPAARSSCSSAGWVGSRRTRS